MLTDWFTIIAQVVNFVILLWLMKRFLYKPILKAIDEREKRIAAGIADAEAKKIEAQKEHEEFQRRNEEFDQQREALFSKATDEAQVEHRRLLEEARKSAAELIAKRQEALRSEEHSLRQEISLRTEQEVFAIARKALRDLGGMSLEERLGQVFMQRLQEMDGPAKTDLAEALEKASGPALVRSAFALPEEQRTAIQRTLNELLGTEIHVRFETSPHLISGIELSTNGQKVAWSIADYLASMERVVGDLLRGKDEPEGESERREKELKPGIGNQ